MRRIYVASSWRNNAQPFVVEALRGAGHQVYDFRHPAPGDDGFQWAEIDPEWQCWDPAAFVNALDHPIAVRGYLNDLRGMADADLGVLVLPSGRSAHLEAGYFVGKGVPLYIFLTERQEPELMYRMATSIFLDLISLVRAVSVFGGSTSHEAGRK